MIIGFVRFKCEGLKGAQMLAQALTHTISHLMENERKKRKDTGEENPCESVTSVTPSPHHTCSFTSYCRSFSLSLSFSLSIPIYWMRFANQRQIIYPHNEVKYKDASQTTGDQFERKSSFTIMWIKKI